MLMEAFADHRQIVNDLDAEALEQVAIANAGELQKARRIDGAAADDHVFADLYLVDCPAGALRSLGYRGNRVTWTTSGTPTERVAKGDNALHRECIERARRDLRAHTR